MTDENSGIYSIVQGADWHFGARNLGEQPEYVRKAALATMIICFIGFVAYLIFLVSTAVDHTHFSNRPFGAEGWVTFLSLNKNALSF